MKEIGGYIELEYSNGKEYYSDAIALNTARNCLEYIIKERNISKIYLPYYLCDSVSNKCIALKCPIEYYNVDESFLPLLDKNINIEKNEYVYIVNYYGLLDNDILKKLKNSYINVIIDNVQAFFQEPLENIDTIYSCRKFFGVPDGAYLCTDLKINEDIPLDKSNDRMVHLLGRVEESASQYYSDFKRVSIQFENEEVKQMSKLTHNLLKSIDYQKVKDARTQNFIYLNERLNKLNKLKIDKKIIGAYSYPLYIDNAKSVREKLIQNKIFIPILWPNVLEYEEQLQEYSFTQNILPLPIDQRYNIDDMKYMCDIIIKLMEE